MIWFLEKKFNLPSTTLLWAEYNSTESLTNKYKLFWTKSKQTVNFPNITKRPFPLTPSKNI